MADCHVTHVRKDRYGDITDIGVKGRWERSVPVAIKDIESGLNSYFVLCPLRANIYPATSYTGTKYLKTTADSTTRNNLDELPSL